MKTDLHAENYRPGDRFAHETNDCTVTALTNVTELTYSECHAYLKRAGRKDRRGFHTYRHFGKSKIALGHRFTYIETWAAGRGQMTLARFARLFPRGKFLVCISRHALCIKDGKIYDFSGPRARVKSAWRVEKAFVPGPYGPIPASNPANVIPVAPQPVVPAPVAPAVEPVQPRPAVTPTRYRKVARGWFRTFIPVRVNGSQVIATLEVKSGRYNNGLGWHWILTAPGLREPRTGETFRQMKEITLAFAHPDSKLRNLWTY